ncbi:hypothetical protein EJB05_13573 [Eragrostis curvula]|uniref:RRM domain-containing protein n=1 Tax=Eragrostis curvula TaxID=38414 RepID=A0A5J9VWM2_9POAL|nr:hypothetical protein EJB05_13573 [Eragrostis curvula]
MAPSPPLSWADAPPYHYHGPPLPLPKTAPPEEAAEGGEGGPEEARTLWIGGLLHWMNEDYLYGCFNRVPELVSLKIKQSKHTGKFDDFGFLQFADHTTADHVRQSYNGQKMPNADRDFRLNWPAYAQQPSEKHADQHVKLNSGTQQQDAPQGHADVYSDHSIYVGSLAYDVTSFMLQHLFKSRYPSVKSATVICDKDTGRSRGYGFVGFGDVNELRQAMTEMNGAYCSTRPMRIGPVPDRKMHPNGTQGTDFYHQDSNTSRLFVGNLDQSVTSEDLKQACSPYGEVVDVKVLEAKRCGFVTYANRASAEEAVRMLNGSQLGGSTIKVSYARPLASKQDQLNVGHYRRVQCYGPGYGNFQQQHLQVQVDSTFHEDQGELVPRDLILQLISLRSSTRDLFKYNEFILSLCSENIMSRNYSILAHELRKNSLFWK